MSRWAERLHSLTGTRDTCDTCDTSAGEAVPSVTSVSGVTPSPDGETETKAPSVTTVTSVTGADDKETVRFAPVMDGYFLAGLVRPTSWADPAALPSRGCYCSCCKGQQWWCEATEPKGWRCAICHPPTGLRPDTVETVRTGLSKEPNKALSRTEATR